MRRLAAGETTKAVGLSYGVSSATINRAVPVITRQPVPRRVNSVSGFIGVHWDKEREKWYAQLHKNGKHVWNARFSTPEQAAHAWDAKALEYYGEDAVLNFP